MKFALRAALALSVGLPARGQGQTVAPPVLAFTGGAMRYALGATRDGAMASLRLASPIVPLGRRHWLIEPNASYGWYRADDGRQHHLAVGEIGVQLQAGPRMVQPYVGVGGGVAFTRVDTVTSNYLTGSVAGGVRLFLTDSWGLSGEVRFRWLDLFARRTRELTASLFRILE